jgi:hypothetical protein
VLKAGLLAIQEALGRDGLLDFPRRKNGTPMLTRQGFFERLLKGQASLQDCASADCSAAEADVKRLSLVQLLDIRCKHIDYSPEGRSQVGKASFLGLLDRCASAALAERLLKEQVLADAHKAIVTRQAMLIYGASRELAKLSEEGGGEWWLLAVGGTRRYLHLPSCEVSGAPPSGPVFCYRSFSASDPRDPKRKRVFRWQALLVQDASKWTEDPLATEQKKQKTRLTDAKDKDVQPKAIPKAGGAAASISMPAGFSLFGDFDIEDLFEEFGNDLGISADGSKDKPTSKVVASTAPSPEIDDFFDSLLADSLFEEPGAGGFCEYTWGCHLHFFLFSRSNGDCWDWWWDIKCYGD